jgi:hypothetical protein
MHSSPMREGARPEIVRDNMGHANIDVTRIVYGKSWWEERVDAVIQICLELYMPWYTVFAIAPSARNAALDTCLVSVHTGMGHI